MMSMNLMGSFFHLNSMDTTEQAPKIRVPPYSPGYPVVLFSSSDVAVP